MSPNGDAPRPGGDRDLHRVPDARPPRRRGVERTPQSPFGSIANVLRSSLARPARNSSMRHNARGVPSGMTCVLTTVPDRVWRLPDLASTSQVTAVPIWTMAAIWGASDMCHSPRSLTKRAKDPSETNSSGSGVLEGWLL